ncbi:MAG: cytochrome c oxidase subunit 3 family protein [bacterium]
MNNTAQSSEPGSFVDHLPGGAVVWIVVLLELGTFALFFFGFAWSYAQEPREFSESQQLLHPLSGAINTMVLLTGSWAVARGVSAKTTGKSPLIWLWGAAFSGVAFVAIKINEYLSVFEHGVSLSTNQFWFFYLFLTVLHLVHVIIGIGICAYLATWLRFPNPPALDVIEAGGIYWHLIDLIWVFLFPLLYLSGAFT